MFADKAVGAVVRPFGFKGSRGTWIRPTDDGIALIGSSQRTLPDWIFVHVGLAVVPVEWWEYVTWREGRGTLPLSKEAARYSMHFVETRRRPEPGHVHLPLDPAPEDWARAERVVCAAAAELAVTADDLLRPGRYLEGLLAIEDIGYGMWEQLVVLLAERGESPELDDAIESMYDSYAEHDADPPDRIAGYARDRARARSRLG